MNGEAMRELWDNASHPNGRARLRDAAEGVEPTNSQANGPFGAGKNFRTLERGGEAAHRRGTWRSSHNLSGKRTEGSRKHRLRDPFAFLQPENSCSRPRPSMPCTAPPVPRPSTSAAGTCR